MKKLLFAIAFLNICSTLFSQNSIDQNGLQSTVTDVLSAAALQAKRYEIAKVIYNSHHWQNSSVIEVELFNVRHSSGYEKYAIELGYGTGTTGTAPIITHKESYGRSHDAKITLGEPVIHSTSAGGYPNKVISIYADVRYYGHYKAKISHLRKKVSAFTSQGEIIINENPTGVNVNDFTSPVLLTRNSIWAKNGSDINYMDGKVGIGTSTPGQGISSQLPNLKLHVAGDVTLNSGSKLSLDQNYSVHGYLQYDGSLPKARFKNFGYYGHRFDDNGGTRMVIEQGGNVGIGTRSPDAKLTVNGNIHTREVKVDLQGAVAPDYVFLEDYNLNTLEEVSKHIEEKGHLPNVPSAKEMEQNGVKLKVMTLKLLEKIEELTLYTIQQQKELEDQKEKNTTLEARLSKLEKLIQK